MTNNERKMAEAAIDAVRGLATQIKYLGTGNAGTEIGALEFLAMEIKGLAGAISELAGAIREHE